MRYMKTVSGGVIRGINLQWKALPTRPARHRVKCSARKRTGPNPSRPLSRPRRLASPAASRILCPPSPPSPTLCAMTAFLPLDAAAPFPPTPAFLVPSPDPASHVKRAVKAVLKARRIAVVCGRCLMPSPYRRRILTCPRNLCHGFPDRCGHLRAGRDP